VQWLLAEAIGHFFALDDEKLLVGAMQRVQRVDRCQMVVIGQDDEVVSVLPVPAHDIVRRAVAVAVQGVRVRVAFVPAERRGLARVQRRNGNQNRGCGREKSHVGSETTPFRGCGQAATAISPLTAACLSLVRRCTVWVPYPAASE
jgi:hypothetical protein